MLNLSRFRLYSIVSQSDERRFWAHVNKTPDCWLWKSKEIAGYGRFMRAGKSIRAHRFMWQMLYGRIPNGLVVMHKCDNRRCVRPSHLGLGTPKDNTLDAVAKGRMSSGERHWNSVLDWPTVQRIRVLRNLGLTYHYIGKQVGVSASTVYHVTNGVTWKRRQSNDQGINR